MVKKELLDGSPCKKCIQAEDVLRRRGLWEQIDEVVFAVEADPASRGMKLAAAHRVELAPFFIVKEGEREVVYTSVIELMRERLASPMSAAPPPVATNGAVHPVNGANGTNGASAHGHATNGANGAAQAPELTDADVEALNRRFAKAPPQAVVDHVLELYGESAAIAFSGAEDVAVIDMAAKTGRPFSVFTLDTGRLHPETYRFLDKVRAHYGIRIVTMFPPHLAVEALVQKKGLFSFYQDGHGECCGLRKVEPLHRALGQYRAWLSGQRRDQSPTRSSVECFELDRAHRGTTGGVMLKVNPLAHASLADVWTYLREERVPTNELHDRGYISIGCEPCTRASRPGEHERASRWWWEEATQRECGLHTAK
ncbi:MAG TPA: phosphoadenylyl-sulfate reductase [Polyangiaceae bacterium]|nr:phosphoadenylyl-sulfate reductase [Polyangiaceae bacterium]